MFRTPTIICVGLFATALSAQEPVMRIEKSVPVEMQADPKKTAPSATVQQMNVVVSGTPDVVPAPAACKEKTKQDRLDCMHGEVLTALRAKLTEADAGAGPLGSPVVISFAINEYGEMKDIHVDNASSPDLPKKVIVALYAMPKFAPAEKDGKTIGTKVTVSYPFDALFPPK